MFQSYLKTAFRNLIKHPLYSFINIIGLAVGLGATILITLFVRGELGYDSWIKDADRIVRMHTAYTVTDTPPFLTVRSAGRVMEALRAYAPEDVEYGVRLARVGATILRDGDVFNETMTFADSDFFKIFDLPFAHGTAETAFANVGGMILSEEMAIKYFGRTDVIGETLTLCCLESDQTDVKISGVLKDLGDDTHFDIDFLSRLQPEMFESDPSILQTWTSVNVYTYFKLQPGVSVQSFQDLINYWLDNDSPFREIFSGLATQSDENQVETSSFMVTDILQLKLMPLPDLYLQARGDAGSIGDMKPLGDIRSVETFTGVALMVLLIACINFTNLSTARASQRAKEVALRKVVGAARKQLVVQFLGEAILLCLVGLVLATALVELALPTFSDFVGKPLSFDLLNLTMIAQLVGLVVLVGLVSGAYPALHLSRFLPAAVLKANQSSDASGTVSFRTALVVFQFAISIGLIACTAVVYMQTEYARTFDTGFTKENKLALYGLRAARLGDGAEALKQSLLRVPGVEGVAFSSEVPSEDNENNAGFRLLEAGENLSVIGSSTILNYYTFGPGFFEMYDVEPIAGRTFNEKFGTDRATPSDGGQIGTGNVMLNVAATRQLGFSKPEDAVGRVLRESRPQSGVMDLTIVGVVPDLYFRSIRFGVRPSIYLPRPDSFKRATLQFRTDDVSELVRAVEQVWKRHAPSVPFSYGFVDELMAAQYARDEAQAELFAAFSFLAIFIACLGLYGLISFSLERRTKEIALRKVMGANVRDIVKLLSWQFAKPVVIATLIASPIAWWNLSDWLQQFVYRIDLTPLPFIAAGVGALIIAWLTAGSHAYRVARQKPIRALRYE